MKPRVPCGIFLLAAFTAAGCGGGHETSRSGETTAQPAGAVAPAQQRQILYYRNPMGLADTSAVPKKDAMGMDYVPVYAGDEARAGRIRIGLEKLQRLGVRSEAATRRVLSRTLRVSGTLQVDERRQWTVSPKFEGWITELHVGTTGASVRRGDALLEVYSPDLLSAEEDFRVAVAALGALQAADREARDGAERLVRSSSERLRNLGIAAEDLPRTRDGAVPRRNLVLRAERDGVVLEKAARVGMRFMPGEALYQLADLSTLWLIGSVSEQDVALVRVGARATVTTVAYPGRTFAGTVTFVSPVMQPETRTVQVRIELANREGLLKPAMFGSVDLSATQPAASVAVLESAILDTGTRRLVLVDRGGGEFEARSVETGIHADGYSEVLSGVAEGERVVVDGNFLIDSESNLRAAIGDVGAHSHESGTAPGNPASAVPPRDPSTDGTR